MYQRRRDGGRAVTGGVDGVVASPGRHATARDRLELDTGTQYTCFTRSAVATTTSVLHDQIKSHWTNG